MANPYQRCSRYWKKDNPPVQCERWDGHTWRHSAFDHDGLLLEWGGVEAPKRDGCYLLSGFDSDGLPLQGEEHVPWNQPVPNNLEVDETATDDESLLDQLQELERRASHWEREAARLERQLELTQREAGLSQQQLHDVLDKLETIRRLTNGVPTRADA